MSSAPLRPNSLTAEYRIPRERMLERLRQHYGIRDERVLEAMRTVPRHFFVPEALQSRAYGDHALPIAANQTISQPFIVARMTELLELDERGRVLEIGAGSGYQTAVLARLAAQVYAIERIADLAREAQARIRQLGIYNATVKCFDGTLGWSAHAPYTGVLVAAGGPEVPEPLMAQLAVGGRLVIPVGESRESQRLVRVTRTEKGYAREDHGPCAFVPLIGHYGWSPESRG
ncbi:MAG TPA: protein-L-isoaspartate(D-aspartate) O-methyltransferase [Pyrinomonadaceae bacterium]|nr:protein-L-isoaspartate(D-aspartate) O-methyltransferase [Pyrinomonadaceae bacterium]